MEEKKSNSRRNFLKAGLITGAAATVGLGSLDLLSKEETSKIKTGKKIRLLSPEGKIVEVDESVINPSVTTAHLNIREGIPGKKFVMVLDLAKCGNAGKCKEACSKMHYLPEDRSYIKIFEMKDAEATAPYYMPANCFHCDDPPCVKVCPVDATFKREDGIVAIDNERCIGCRFCMAACPYTARVFNWGEEQYKMTVEDMKDMKPHEMCSSHVLGTVEKCDFCPGKAVKGELPDCVNACPNGVFYFGDENEDTVTNGEETLRFKELLKNRAGYRLMEELGTKPRVYYLPPVNRLFPFEE
ncbi:MAG: hydrogenase [Bacteroidetes bacterium RIFCSPLOWO2_12_FULL_35_15]|nr:MAG: hydrogenase [Bacteroidetes bacterium RIFCSPLOWO2_12_FULL_35_15]